MAETKKVVAAKKTTAKPAAAKPTVKAASPAKATEKAAVAAPKVVPPKKVGTVKKAAPAADKTSAPKPAAAEPKSKAVKAKTEAKTHTEVIFLVTDEQRYRMIAEAAYYRAERHHFQSDHLRDWIEAERDIDMLLTGRS